MAAAAAAAAAGRKLLADPAIGEPDPEIAAAGLSSNQGAASLAQSCHDAIGR